MARLVASHPSRRPRALALGSSFALLCAVVLLGDAGLGGGDTEGEAATATAIGAPHRRSRRSGQRPVAARPVVGTLMPEVAPLSLEDTRPSGSQPQADLLRDLKVLAPLAWIPVAAFAGVAAVGLAGVILMETVPLIPGVGPLAARLAPSRAAVPARLAPAPVRAAPARAEPARTAPSRSAPVVVPAATLPDSVTVPVDGRLVAGAGIGALVAGSAVQAAASRRPEGPATPADVLAALSGDPKAAAAAADAVAEAGSSAAKGAEALAREGLQAGSVGLGFLAENLPAAGQAFRGLVQQAMPSVQAGARQSAEAARALAEKVASAERPKEDLPRAAHALAPDVLQGAAWGLDWLAEKMPEAEPVVAAGAGQALQMLSGALAAGAEAAAAAASGMDAPRSRAVAALPP